MSRRRDVGSARAHAEGVAEGVYEHLVTEQLARELAATPASQVIEPVGDGAAHVELARHLGREIERALATLPQERRAEEAGALARRLLDHLATLVPDDAADVVREQRPVPPPRRLVAVHHGRIPERPATPLATSTLLTRGRNEPALGHELAREIAIADRIDAIVAFVTMGGVRAILDQLHAFARRPGTRLRLLTTTFTGTTELAALDLLARLPNAEVKVSYDTRRTRLHAKAWLFQRDSGLTTAYVGSANLTSTALGAGQEWMVKICAADLGHVIDKFAGTFETLWADPEFERYSPDQDAQRTRLRAALASEASGDAADGFLVAMRPFPFQEEILDRLAAERALHGRRKNLIVAATGTGKTVIAAFDYARRCAGTGVPPRLLFLAHREELLVQARRTFRYVLQDAAFGELLAGGAEPRSDEHLFATIQSAASTGLVDRLGPDYYRHVIVDECHHIPAASYQAIVPRLAPDLLIGLTATPERADGKSLLPDFEGHIGAELRLWHALEDQLLVPFEYYGLSDGVDLRGVRWTRSGYDLGDLGALYTGDDARAALVRHQLARRVADVRGIRALGFCVSVEHAKFMARRFTEAGIPSLAVYGADPDGVREEAPRLLRDRAVNVLFTCDLYNEGVDLPYVDTLLLLRPTQSATLFLQQLGRGLRHSPGKTSCLVLDFIGQHHERFRFDAILAALTGIPRARLRADLEQGFPYLPSGCTLQLDGVAQGEILRSLRATLAGARRLTAELRELAAAGGPPRLAAFLAQTGRELDDVYAAGGWTTLRRAAGLAPAGGPAGGEALEALEALDELSRRLGFLRHVDEPDRLRGYHDLCRAAARGEPRPLSELDRRRLYMLDAQLEHRGVLRAAEGTIEYMASRPAIVDELGELREVLDERIGLPVRIVPVPEWPLALHRHYSRREIAAAVGYVTAGEKKISLQAGILRLPEQQRELLFVTLDKSGESFSPTTRYRDYAISPSLFHWETQAAASVTRPSGRRYLESATNGWSFYLFVRTDPDAAFAFLGPVRYEAHAGDRPIAITWRLEWPMPAALYERYATLRQG
jgi:superfamily II DNA or RNA helicase/HKD family nuclease